MGNPENNQPENRYDFADWQIGARDLAGGEAVLVALVREEIRLAFDCFGQGQWEIEPKTGKLTWIPSEEFYPDVPPPVFITIKPRDVVPLLTGELARDLSSYPEYDAEKQEYEEDKWDSLWGERMKIITAWQSALNQCVTAMNEMLKARQKFRPD